jgi:hypothetical protein|tara:strand:- start:167 stop:712 length:546 start_codon:yes stop_codon:yes gene_type:complete
MSTLKVNSIIPTAGVATGQGGGIVQTIMGELRTNVSQSISGTGGTGSSAVLSATITPTSTSSKVKISGSITVGMDNPTNTVYIKLYKNDSELSAASSSETPGNRNTGVIGSDLISYAWQVSTIPFHYIDSPNTTSATTYQIYLAHSSGNSTTVYVNRTYTDNNNGSYVYTASHIILEEVSA